MVDNKKKSKSQYSDTEAIYNIYGEQSVKTIYERNYHRYLGSPGAETLDISNKVIKQVVDIEGFKDKEDDISAISDLSREALMDLIFKQKKNKTGSYPKNKYYNSHSKPY